MVERLEVSSGLRTATGARPRNEDYAACFLGTPGQQAGLGVLAAIADGVGGAKGGRVAAELTVRTLIDGYFGRSELQSVRRTCARTLDSINRWVHTLGHTDAALEGMACTVTALILRGRQAHLVHVGDTRLYRLRDDTLTQLTSDHVPKRGAVRNVLTRAVGPAEGLRIDYAVEPSRVHDRYLLCSDGVHGALSDGRIRDELARRAAPEETARQLVDAALAARIGDNATALVVDVLSLPPANQFDLEAAIGALPIRPPPKAGSVVDGFELRTMLSDGQYSRVFRGHDQVNKRDVIIKLPKPLTGADAVLRQAFLREAWIAARVSSPFICEVIDVPLERRTCLYTVMPFYEGETLEHRLSRRPGVSLGAGLDIAIKLTRGVAALHRAGIIHRDIKPDNVVLEPGGGLKLLDLGVARLPNMEDFPAADIPGTPSYMAPELFAGEPGDERSDLFALGVTIYRMFTKAYPYGEIEPFSKPRFGRPTPMSARRPELPAWLDQAVARAVAVTPSERYDDAVELIFALVNGSVGGAAGVPRRRPLYARNPLLAWQIVSVALALALLAKCAVG